MFILTANCSAWVPLFLHRPSQIIVTFALAVFVIGTVLSTASTSTVSASSSCSCRKACRARFCRLSSRSKSISFLSRPISLSVRLFANMLAGHITLKVFAGFVASLSAFGALGIGGAILPLIMTVALTGLEFLSPSSRPMSLRLLTSCTSTNAVHPGALRNISRWFPVGLPRKRKS
ncbi:hypothetical protein F2981_10095 [Sinorhizobium meliloti]|nr:hypothetical protein [Sinorhizobium meliloti]